MTRPDPEAVRRYIVTILPEHPADIVRVVAEKFGISRQASHAHVAKLVKAGLVETQGQTRKRSYHLISKDISFIVDLSQQKNRDEDLVWREKVDEHLADLPPEVGKICYHGFTEIFNNAIDHSDSPTATVIIQRSAKDVTLRIMDSGVGIFEKIRSRLNLHDGRQAILELSKGKLTTDPKRHTGEGIYFTSRMFDRFTILSGTLFFVHIIDNDDWLIEDQESLTPGTTVAMTIAVGSLRKIDDVYHQAISETAEKEFAFSSTHVPLNLAIYGNENLVSRSQAKRVLRRFDRFQEVMLDFTGIEEIGQAFADEIFRVYKLSHPEVNIIAIHTNGQVARMISRAQAALRETPEDY